LSVISVRISEEIKRKMNWFKHVDWAKYIQNTIEKKIREEEMNLACQIMDKVAMKTSGKWSGVNEIRKWREKRDIK